MAAKPEDRFKFDWQRAVCGEECQLAPMVRLVALTMSIHMDGDGTSCRPGAKLTADETGLDLRTVKRAVKVLIGGGWLVVTFRGGSPRGVRLATVYRAQIPTTGVTGPPVTGVTGPPVAQPDRWHTGQRPVALVLMTGGTGPPHQSVPIMTNSASGSRSVDLIGFAEKWRDLPEPDFLAHLAARGVTDPDDVAAALEHRRRLAGPP